MASESTAKTIMVALLVTIVSSIMVSGTVVALRPLQEKNKQEEKKKNVLLASGVYQKGEDIDTQFANFEPLLVDVSSGSPATEKISAEDYDMFKMLKDPATTIELSITEDIAGIRRISRLQMVYLLKKNGQIENLILPIYGKGLWSTMYGFLVLEKDLNTVKGITFYEHGETPGLGGEIDNPRWKALWQGKKLFDNDEYKFAVLKGAVSSQDPLKDFHIDGLSGATLTIRGVDAAIKFWLGKHGYGEFISYLKEQEQPTQETTNNSGESHE